MSIDKLQKTIRKLKNPTVAGLDPKPEYIPPHILQKHIAESGETLKAAAGAYYEFNCGLMDALSDIVPAVKPQSAYYEMLGPDGAFALKKTMDYAREKGFHIILDVKRNDIGSTAEAYSLAYLGNITVGSTKLSGYDCDSITINAYLGSDGVRPFIETCKEHDKSIFALVKTSNPSSGELQDLIAGDRYLHAVVGDLMERLSLETVGEYGFTCVGAVVGATYPAEAHTLRRRLKNTFFLVPGYGAQGGGAEDVAPAFNKYGHGAIINSSRAIMCAWQKTGGDGSDFKEAARAEAIKMRDDLRNVITIV